MVTFKIDPETGERIRTVRPIRNWRNYDHEVHENREVFIGNSMTVPGMALSMEEIVQRHSRGAELPKLQGFYTNDDPENPMPDFSRMSKPEIYEFAKENERLIQTIQLNLAEAEKQRLAKEAADKEAEFQRLKALVDSKQG